MRAFTIVIASIGAATSANAGQSICNENWSNDNALHGPINYNDFDFNYESRADKRSEGGYLIDYCIQNNSQNGVVYIHWHDGSDTTYLKKGIPGGSRKTRGGKVHFVDSVPSEEKDLRFDWTTDYDNVEEVGTFYVASIELETMLHLAQFSPEFPDAQDLPEEFGAEISEIATNADLMSKYLDFLSEKFPDASSLSLGAWSREWVPASAEVARKLAAGERIEEGESNFYEVSYSVLSEISLKERDVSVRIGVTIPESSRRIAVQSETLEGVTLVVDELDLKVSGAEMPASRMLEMGTLDPNGKLEVLSASATLSYADVEISETVFDFWSQ